MIGQAMVSGPTSVGPMRGGAMSSSAMISRRIGLLALLGAALLLPSLPAAAQAPASAVPVTVAPAAKRDVPILLRNIGTVQGFQSALIRSRVDGTLEQIFFTEGQEVKRGDRLALIDPRPYQAVYDQAVARRSATEAQLANARLDLTRSRQLVANNYTPQQTVDTRTSQVAQLEAQLRSDEAAIAAAKTNLDYTVITAPFDGRMGLRQIDPGNVVRLADSQGIGIVTITQVRPISVVFTLPQDAMPAIQAAMGAGKLAVQAYASDDKLLLGTGELLTTDNTMDSTTGTIRLKAVFPNADNKLWPGQFVNARLQLEVKRGVITVPSAAVQRSQTNLFVYTVKPDNTVAVVPVTLGQDDGATAIVTKGLDEGIPVVIAGQSRLRAGAAVTVTPAKPNS